jgi:hypothetical protein
VIFRLSDDPDPVDEIQALGKIAEFESPLKHIVVGLPTVKRAQILFDLFVCKLSRSISFWLLSF